jgi:hypothetical protein
MLVGIVVIVEQIVIVVVKQLVEATKNHHIANFIKNEWM